MTKTTETTRRLIHIETTEDGMVEHDLGPATTEQAEMSDRIAANDGMGIFALYEDGTMATGNPGPDWQGRQPKAVYVEA